MKVVMTIAGSDSSGGAGIQADLKTFEAFGVFGCSVLTVLTAQNSCGVTQIHEVDPMFVKKQIETVLEDFEVSAIKIGMLYSNEIIDVVRDCIKDLNIPIILDPVFISKAGSKLLNDDAIENLKTLFPYSYIITPNLYEAKALFDYKEFDEDNLQIDNLECKVIIKNQVIQKEDTILSADSLFDKQEKKVFFSDYMQSNNTHGTGCSFSSAIASNIALGVPLEDSIKISKSFIYNAIKYAPNLGNCKGPISHKEGYKCIML